MDISDFQRHAGSPLTDYPENLDTPAKDGWTASLRKVSQRFHLSKPPINSQKPLELHREYEELVLDYFARYGIEASNHIVEAKSLGYKDGREVYVVLVAPKDPDPTAALQLTCAAPLIEKKVHSNVNSRWIGDYTQFAGVWTHWPSQTPIPEEMRKMLRSLHDKTQTKVQQINC